MKKLLLVFTTIVSFGLTAQDEPQPLQNDSLLLFNQSQSSRVLAAADSVKFADSLAQQALIVQINDLEKSDVRAKERLQRKLDSLTTAKRERASKLKTTIDSLRSTTRGVPVVFRKDTLMFIYSKLGPFSPSERATRVEEKLAKLGDDHTFDIELLNKFETEEGYDVMYSDMIVMTINERDAFWLDKPIEVVATEYVNILGASILEYKSETGVYKTTLRFALILLVAIILYFMIKMLNRGFSKLVTKIALSGNKYMKGIKLRDYEFLTPEREFQLAKWLLNVIKWLVILVIMYIALPIIFSIFPTTEGVARTLLGYVTNPLTNMLKSIVGFIPELITITVIMTATVYVVRFLKFLTTEVQRGKLVLPGFYPDWALPTFNLLRVIIYAFAFVIIFPYLPGSDSPVFKGVSVFFGLLISLGSSSAISNIIAGLVITYMRPFKLGDRVKIGDVTGDVIQKTMLVTRVRTIKNEDISIPNAAVLNGSTINYSSSAQELGLILHSTVTIGYDVPWKQVHELLISAALKCELVEKEPSPFVFQTSLDDYYVSYQINAHTKVPDKGSKTYSELHANIQDAFNEANVEILSPHYRAQRDGNMVTIPQSYLAPDYTPPMFNVNLEKDE